MVTRAHQKPSHDPRRNGGGNSPGLLVWSYRKKQIFEKHINSLFFSILTFLWVAIDLLIHQYKLTQCSVGLVLQLNQCRRLIKLVSSPLFILATEYVTEGLEHSVK